MPVDDTEQLRGANSEYWRNVRVKVRAQTQYVEYPVLVLIGHTDRPRDVTRRADAGQLASIIYDAIAR